MNNKQDFCFFSCNYAMYQIKFFSILIFKVSLFLIFIYKFF